MATSVAKKPTQKELADALKLNPTNSWALYNLGLLNYLKDDYKEAIKHWKTLKKLEPLDWDIRMKLIQAYWGAGQTKAANLEITELRAARDTGKHKDLTEKGFFICDQFQTGKVRVFALEYYELKGERPLAWKFILKSGDDTLDQHFSIGCYPSATEFARAEGAIGPKDRRYHLDGYRKGGAHKTYGFYTNRPDYGKIRDEVRRIISGDQKSISSMTPQKEEGEKDDADQATTAPESKPKADATPKPKLEERSQ